MNCQKKQITHASKRKLHLAETSGDETERQKLKTKRKTFADT